MKFILMALALISVINSPSTIATFGCTANICDPANSCYDGCLGNIPRPDQSSVFSLTRQCTVEKADSKITTKFSVQNDQRAILRINDQLKIDVINNS